MVPQAGDVGTLGYAENDGLTTISDLKHGRCGWHEVDLQLLGTLVMPQAGRNGPFLVISSGM